jgi:L-fucose isomerase-like protein
VKQKVCVGLAGIQFSSSFWAFRDTQFTERARQLRALTGKLGASVKALPRAFRDAEGAEAAAKQLNDSADLVILDVATFPEGKAAGAFLDRLIPPVMLWSRPESEHGTHIGHNSFCGANFIAGNLALKQRRFRCLFGEAGSRDFAARLRTAIGLVSAAKQAAGSTIGLFGEGIVPKFFDIDISAADRTRLEQRWKIRFEGIPIKALVEKAGSYKEDELAADAKSFVRCFKRIAVPSDALSKQVRLYKAIADITRHEGYASTAVRCWPELQSTYGAWPCPGVGVLNDMGIPCACEGDPAGALDMLLATHLSERPSTVVDIVDWHVPRNSFAIWHCGPTACSWADRGGASLIPHNVDGANKQGRPAQGLPGVVDMTFAPGPVTVFRTLGAVDDEFVVQGSLVRSPSRRISGSHGSVAEPTVYGRKRTVDALREEIMNRALPHHFVAARGHLFS